MLKTISIKTKFRTQFTDITSQLQDAVRACNIENGACIVFVPHTTAGITINENADPSVAADIQTEFNKCVPFDDDYTHIEGNSAAHIKSSMVGCSETIIVENSSLVLGTWQGVYFCEFDGPRTRRVHVKVISA